MTPTIVIDYTKCSNPLTCGVCMRTCTPAVFITYPLKRKRDEICKEWRLEPTFKDKCTFCKKCEEVCPKGAIKVTD